VNFLKKALKGIKDDTNDLKLTQYAYEELNFNYDIAASEQSELRAK